jgi:hypothetical protein
MHNMFPLVGPKQEEDSGSSAATSAGDLQYGTTSSGGDMQGKGIMSGGVGTSGEDRGEAHRGRKLIAVQCIGFRDDLFVRPGYTQKMAEVLATYCDPGDCEIAWSRGEHIMQVPVIQGPAILGFMIYSYILQPAGVCKTPAYIMFPLSRWRYGGHGAATVKALVC